MSSRNPGLRVATALGGTVLLLFLCSGAYAAAGPVEPASDWNGVPLPRPTRPASTPSRTGPTVKPKPTPGPTTSPSSRHRKVPSPPPGTPDPSTAPTRSASPSISPSRAVAPSPSLSPGAGGRTTTIVTLGFDDNTADQFAIDPLLQSLGMHAVFYVNSGRLDVGADYLTTSQVQTLQAHGNEIGGHTVSHPHLSQEDAAEQQRQICVDRFHLLAAGLQVSTFAYPFGDIDASSQVAAQQCGYNSARTLGGISCQGCDVAEAVPPAAPYRMRSVSGVTSATTAAQLTVAVQRAQATGGWVQIAFQHLCPVGPCASNGFPLPQFETFLQWLDRQRRSGALAISTVHDVLGESVRPAVAGPAATVPGLQVTNASFERAGVTPDSTQCFDVAAADGNVFAAHRVNDHRGGAWAQQVVVSTVVGSGVRLQSAQDLGSCAPSIGPRHAYRIGVWYKSSAPVQIVAYLRRPNGGYTSFGTSAAFPASSHWTQAVWTTKGATATQNLALGVGVLFKTVGTYVIDDLSVADAGLAPVGRPVQNAAVETDSQEANGPGDLFVPPDTTPVIAAGPTATTLAANRRHGWELTAEITAALAIMWGIVVALDRRFGQLHRATRLLGDFRRSGRVRVRRIGR